MPTTQIASDLERDYEAVLNFRHDFQELCGELDDLTLSDVCKADEIYVTAGEKGIEKEDETVILCTDDYTIYDDIDEYDGIDAHLAITHDDTYVIGDAHVNTCENRHSFLRQWLAKFRGVSKHHLQGYLNFLGLLLNDDTDWFSKSLSYELSG